MCFPKLAIYFKFHRWHSRARTFDFYFEAAFKWWCNDSVTHAIIAPFFLGDNLPLCLLSPHFFAAVSGRILWVPRWLSPAWLVRYVVVSISVPDSLKSVQEALTCIQYTTMCFLILLQYDRSDSSRSCQGNDRIFLPSFPMNDKFLVTITDEGIGSLAWGHCSSSDGVPGKIMSFPFKIRRHSVWK